MTLSASVRRLTERPRKSRTSVAPPARIRSPPNPVTIESGSSLSISAASAPAYKSPDGSPHESITRRRSKRDALPRLLENARRERDVELDRLDVALDAGHAGATEDGVEGNLDAVDAAIVAVALLDPAVRPVVAGAIDQAVVAIDEQRQRPHGGPGDLEAGEDGLVRIDFTHDQLAGARFDQHRDEFPLDAGLALRAAFLRQLVRLAIRIDDPIVSCRIELRHLAARH